MYACMHALLFLFVGLLAFFQGKECQEIIFLHFVTHPVVLSHLAFRGTAVTLCNLTVSMAEDADTPATHIKQEGFIKNSLISQIYLSDVFMNMTRFHVPDRMLPAVYEYMRMSLPKWCKWFKKETI